MKTKRIKTLALAALMGFASLGLAAATTPGKDTKSEVRQKIQRAVSLPEELKTPGFKQTVKVAFVLDAQGCVSQVAANTLNLALKQKLEDQFRQISMPELKAGSYSVELDFIVY